MLKLTRLRLLLLLLTTFVLLTEIPHHNHTRTHVPRPARPLDPPFQTACRDPPVHAPRENGVIVMLARNRDVEGAERAMSSLEGKFNRWFHYPVVFINDEPWEDEFVRRLEAVASGGTEFVTVPSGQWGFPAGVDAERVRGLWAGQEQAGSLHAGREGYHHMCRYQSGLIFRHEALAKYRWYWRVEPDVEFSCAITYDPFAAMKHAGKVYGYTIALWEIGETVHGLWRFTSEYKKRNGIPTTRLWKSMVESSWAPFILRPALGWLFPATRNAEGDKWNLCHLWSNFEIADMDFFRSEQYRNYFEAVDREGGFYYERWGDAAVHSLAAALFLEPEQLHYFADFGYYHKPFFNCPANAPGGQLPGLETLGDSPWQPEQGGGIGCRCECDPNAFSNRPVCLNKIRQGVQG